MRIIALGIIPEYQRKGIDAVLYYEVGTRANKIGIRNGDASWILEDNVMMNRALQSIVNGKVYKTHRLFDKKHLILSLLRLILKRAHIKKG